MVDLSALVASAEKDGWASGSVDLESIPLQAGLLRWMQVAPDRGEVSPELRSADGSAAGESRQQRLHTVGACLRDPPDFVLLIAQNPSTPAIRLWLPSDASVEPLSPIWSAFRHGMFLINNGRDSFYASAFCGSRYRYDSECMIASDARALEVDQFIEQQLASSAGHEWSAVGQVLVVDNRRALHAHSAMAQDGAGADLKTIAFRVRAVP
jgi:hypothetical protein